uniref:Uncharacterized protein n=1 Tax=Nelumbo nucifera TaxID=4432 RepID=A0A822YN50_NELNU|nr:TPA_asm: hypothetical protein HUJ06_011580 [Nelumbo nucifera]
MCLLTVRAIKRSSQKNLSNGPIVFLSQGLDISFSWRDRSANRAAHVAAQKGLSSSCLLLNTAPAWLSPVLLGDLANSSRSSESFCFSS